MSNTDNRTSVDSGALTMALNVLRRAGKNEVSDTLEQTAYRDHIKAMQRDCRTCENLLGCQYSQAHGLRLDCTNHDKYQPMLEFKQLTRSE